MTDQPTPAIVALWKLEEGKRVPSVRWNWGRINIRKATAKSDKYVKSTKKIQISKTVKRIRFKVHIIRSLLHGSTGGPRCVNPESTILSLRKYELRQQCYTNRAKYLVQNQI